MTLHEFFLNKWDTFGDLQPEQLATLPYIYGAFYEGDGLDCWPPELAESCPETGDVWLWELLQEISVSTGRQLLRDVHPDGCYCFTFGTAHE